MVLTLERVLEFDGVQGIYLVINGVRWSLVSVRWSQISFQCLLRYQFDVEIDQLVVSDDSLIGAKYVYTDKYGIVTNIVLRMSETEHQYIPNKEEVFERTVAL